MNLPEEEPLPTSHIGKPRLGQTVQAGERREVGTLRKPVTKLMRQILNKAPGTRGRPPGSMDEILSMAKKQPID